LHFYYITLGHFCRYFGECLWFEERLNNTEKSEYNIPFDTELYSIYADNKLFLPDYNIWYDLTDMTEHSMGEYDGFNVIPYNEKYILYSDNNFVKLTEEELLALDKEN